MSIYVNYMSVYVKICAKPPFSDEKMLVFLPQISLECLKIPRVFSPEKLISQENLNF